MSTPVVFVHGTRSSGAVWQAQVAELDRRGVPSIALDLPGHGSRTQEHFTLTGALEAIDAAISQCAQPPLLVGLSLGGYSALEYAGTHPHRLAGLMAVACATSPRRPFVQAYRSAAYRLNRQFGLGGDWTVVHEMLGEVWRVRPLELLQVIDCPVWLVNGARDPLRLGRTVFHRVRPGMRGIVIPEAGHDVNLHQPEKFNAVLLDALQVLDGVRPALLTDSASQQN